MNTIIALSILGILALIAFVVVIVNQRMQIKAQNKPNSQLYVSVRLIEKILSVDEAIPQLPSKLRNEAESFVNDFYQTHKELSK